MTKRRGELRIYWDIIVWERTKDIFSCHRSHIGKLSGSGLTAATSIHSCPWHEFDSFRGTINIFWGETVWAHQWFSLLFHSSPGGCWQCQRHVHRTPVPPSERLRRSQKQRTEIDCKFITYNLRETNRQNISKTKSIENFLFTGWLCVVGSSHAH